MKFVIITGMSGAGRTRALRCLEDMNFYCVDNLPPALISKFAEMCNQSQDKLSHAALVVDSRGGEMFEELEGELDKMDAAGYKYEIVFLDATDDRLITRYKETRRLHPLSPNGRVIDGILQERIVLKNIRARATHILDTTNMNPQHLKKRMKDLFVERQDYVPMSIDIVSFGFKFGIPLDSDLVFDVRFLPNPFYVPELKPKTGLDEDVQAFIMQYEQSRTFCDKLIDMVLFLIPQYVEEGKGNLIISVGCTGGRHRSVAIANCLYKAISEKYGRCNVNHRDIAKH